MKIKTKKKAQNKKKKLVLILPVVLMFLSACTGSVCYVSKTNSTDGKHVKHILPTPVKSKTDRGIYLTISKRSSLNINVECIVDYVQGELVLTGENESIDHSDPWVYWNWYF
jgi:flagellar basal body-associated protein FliL